jgi:hypothetical protein
VKRLAAQKTKAIQIVHSEYNNDGWIIYLIKWKEGTFTFKLVSILQQDATKLLEEFHPQQSGNARPREGGWAVRMSMMRGGLGRSTPK